MTIGRARIRQSLWSVSTRSRPQGSTDEAERVRTVTDLDRFAASLVGSAHLIASVAGRVRVQGTVTGVRRVFSAVVDGAAVAADRADVLAALLAAGIDEERLALHLMEPHILFPVAGLPVWRGVDVLRGDSYLVLDGGPAAPVSPVVDAARPGGPDGRRRPRAAGGARPRPSQTGSTGRELVSCDLGGLDSTALCSLAARGDAKVVAYTAASPDPLADDVAWARKTVAGLPGVEHEVIPAEEMPLVFHGLGSAADDAFDEPCTAIVDRDRWLIIAASGRRARVPDCTWPASAATSCCTARSPTCTTCCAPTRGSGCGPCAASPPSTGGRVGRSCGSWPTRARTRAGSPAWRTP